MAAPRPERLRITPRSAATAVALFGLTLVLLRVAASSQRVIGWILAAAAIAGLVRPLVVFLDRRLPRGLAVALVVLAIVGSIGLVAYRVVDGVSVEMARLRRAAPAAAERLERGEGRASELARQAALSERVERFVEEAPARLRGGTPAEALRAATTRGVAYLATGMLSLFFVLHGAALAAGAARQIGDEQRRERLRRIASSAYKRAFAYARGSIAMAIAAGLIAYALASTAGVPGAAPLALWVALWDTVPLIGVVVGAAPIVALGSVGDPTRGVALALAFAAYEVIETVVVQRRLERSSVRLGPFLTAAGGFAGLELYGIGGALISVLVLALAVAALDEATAGSVSLDDQCRSGIIDASRPPGGPTC